MQAGHYPDFIKIARITPIYKAEDPQDFGNYRPISVLSVFSKIFETVLQERLLRFFGSNGCINNGQYGFRRKHSTSMAVIDIVENIRSAWDRGDQCLRMTQSQLKSGKIFSLNMTISCIGKQIYLNYGGFNVY